MNTTKINSKVGEPIHFDTELIKRHGGRGPRYTSYPTAVQFSDELTADKYLQNALASNNSDVPLSLYVHIPFCHSLCYYCGCNKIVTHNQTRVQEYMKNLYLEIDMQAELFSRDRKVEQLHFGGGTPTYLDDEQLSALMQKLRDSFTFDESEQHEFSIEVDPRTVDDAAITRLTELGFNRLSLGIQDFDPRVQEAVNRIQTPDEVQQLVDTSRRSGFKSISFDLIYGLPHQTAVSFDNTLDLVIAMQPDRIAVYNYAHLPERFKGQRMIDAADIPTPETKLEILHHTIDRLGAAGYIYIGMDHFARPDDDLVTSRQQGTLQRNFQGYSTHRNCDLIGLGVSSISSIGNVYAQSAVTTMEYEALIQNGQLPVKKGIEVDADDLLRAEVIQALMCYDSLDFDEFDDKLGIDFRTYFANEIAALQPLQNDGLVSVDQSGIHISPTGRLLLRSIAMVFDRYINPDEESSNFSKAI